MQLVSQVELYSKNLASQAGLYSVFYF